jgi:hypothetical protein
MNAWLSRSKKKVAVPMSFAKRGVEVAKSVFFLVIFHFFVLQEVFRVCVFQVSPFLHNLQFRQYRFDLLEK